MFAAIGVHLHVPRLEDAAPVYGVESFSEELSREADFAELIGLLLRIWQVLLELIDLLAQLLPLPHPARLLLLLQLLLLDLLGLDALLYLYFLLLDSLLDLLDVVQLLPVLACLLPLSGLQLSLSLLLVAMTHCHFR